MPKEFDPAVTRFVRELLPERLPADKTVAEQAKLIGVSDATLSDVLNSNKGVGKQSLPKFAAFFQVSVDQLIRQARSVRYSLPDPGAGTFTLNESPVVDTLEMAREAVQDLVELDGVKEALAWKVVRDVRLNKPSSRGFYREARRVIDGAEGTKRGPVLHEAELGRPSGPPPLRPIGPSTRHKIRGSSGRK